MEWKDMSFIKPINPRTREKYFFHLNKPCGCWLNPTVDLGLTGAKIPTDKLD